MTAPASAPSRVFVVGCARSGTTIAQRLVSESVCALTVPETNFFPALYGDAAWRQYGRLGPRHAASLLRNGLGIAWPRRELARRSLHALATDVQGAPPALPWRLDDCVTTFLAVLDEAAHRAGAPAWVEKSPNHLYYIDHLERTVPGARFVHVLRDGIDTVASLVDAGRRHAGSGNDFSPDLAPNIARWRLAMQWHRRCLGRPGHVLVSLDRLSAQDWPARLGLPRPEAPCAPSLIARSHEVWKANAVGGHVVASDDKRGLLSVSELAQLRDALPGGGDLSRLFPGGALG